MIRAICLQVCVCVSIYRIYIYSFGNNFLCVDTVLFICWFYVVYTLFFSTYDVPFGPLEVGY